MERTTIILLVHNAVFRVISTWVWWLVGAILTILIILAVNGLGLDLEAARHILGTRMYLAVYIEVVSVGLLPLVFALVSRESPADYGLKRQGMDKSLALSLLFVALMFAGALLFNGQMMSDNRLSLSVEFPWNIWYGLLGIIAWGPLEVFFFVWLVSNTDRIYKGRSKTLSWGLLVTLLPPRTFSTLSTPGGFFSY